MILLLLSLSYCTLVDRTAVIVGQWRSPADGAAVAPSIHRNRLVSSAIMFPFCTYHCLSTRVWNPITGNPVKINQYDDRETPPSLSSGRDCVLRFSRGPGYPTVFPAWHGTDTSYDVLTTVPPFAMLPEVDGIEQLYKRFFQEAQELPKWVLPPLRTCTAAECFPSPASESGRPFRPSVVFLSFLIFVLWCCLYNNSWYIVH